MANSKSAKKRIKINQRNNLKNRFYKSTVKTLTKSFIKQLQIFEESENNNHILEARKTLNVIYSLLDKGTKRNVFTKNNAGRQKARLFKYYKKFNNSLNFL